MKKGFGPNSDTVHPIDGYGKKTDVFTSLLTDRRQEEVKARNRKEQERQAEY